ncbi:MAG: HlyD family efflux transporter periplasmic adaptor subunit [Planctomycetes bacterium]|nr:HlyD family efflux transporter periplasmic adaptor subunit [Planctomycetota bacterium]
MSAKKSSNTPWIVGAVIVVGVLGYGIGPGQWFAGTAEVRLRGQTVQKGPMEFSVVQRGNLAARDALSVVSEIEGTSTVLKLVKEGSFVKPGDLLVELDGAPILDKKVQQEIAVQSADAAYKKAKAQFDIQESQNQSDNEAAERKLSFAKLDLKKYLEGDLEQQRKTAEQKIQLAESEKNQAETTLTYSKKLNEKGFLTKSELDRDTLSMERATVSLEQASLAKSILEKYEDPRKRAELEANVKEAERGLERAKLKGEAQIADVEANLRSSEAKLKLEQEKLEKYTTQLAKTKVRSTVSGMVVYTRQEGGRMGGDQPMQEGSQVRERQEILQIPREGGMIVEASIHESVLKQVQVGLPCTVRVDSQPGKEFYGRVTFVALLPDKQSWWANPNLRVYKTEIQIERPAPGSEEALKELRPGMSCAISILADRATDATFVPLQAVFLDKGEPIAFVAKGDAHERRALKVGRSNDKFVEIVDGLKEGEEVLLSAPPGFSPSAAEDSKAAVLDKAGMKPEVPMQSMPNGAGMGERGANGGPPGGAMPSGEAQGGEGRPRRGEGMPGGEGRRNFNREGGGMPGGGRRSRDGAASGEAAPKDGAGDAKPAAEGEKPGDAKKDEKQGDGGKR